MLVQDCEVGARVGRLSKLMKCISYYLKDKDKKMDLSWWAELVVFLFSKRRQESSNLGTTQLPLQLIFLAFKEGSTEYDFCRQVKKKTRQAVGSLFAFLGKTR